MASSLCNDSNSTQIFAVQTVLNLLPLSFLPRQGKGAFWQGRLPLPRCNVEQLFGPSSLPIAVCTAEKGIPRRRQDKPSDWSLSLKNASWLPLDFLACTPPLVSRSILKDFVFLFLSLESQDWHSQVLFSLSAPNLGSTLLTSGVYLGCVYTPLTALSQF